jgi:hypothetical protein
MIATFVKWLNECIHPVMVAVLATHRVMRLLTCLIAKTDVQPHECKFIKTIVNTIAARGHTDCGG